MVTIASLDGILTFTIETQSQITKLCPKFGESRTSEIVGILVFITSLALVCVALRIVSRGIERVKFGWDDWLIFVAMVCHQRRSSNSLLTPLL